MFTYTGLGFPTFDYFSVGKPTNLTWTKLPSFVEEDIAHDSSCLALLDVSQDQPWMLENGCLDALSTTAQDFFGRFVQTFGAKIRQRHLAHAAPDTGSRFKEGYSYEPYLVQARDHVEALGVDAGVLARL
eukprot:SAG31_NODE_3757_length_3912_cov_2.865460_3_plen_130_part_00